MAGVVQDQLLVVRSGRWLCRQVHLGPSSIYSKRLSLLTCLMVNLAKHCNSLQMMRHQGC